MASENNTDQPEKNTAEEPYHESQDGQQTSPLEYKEDDSEGWIKEASKNPEEIKEDFENWDDLPVKEGDLPNWISEISQEKDKLPDENQNLTADLESKEDISVRSGDNAFPNETNPEEQLIEEEKQPLHESDQIGEDFIEISDYEIQPDISSEAVDLTDDMIDDNEQLPEWLEEMIEEPKELEYNNVQLSYEEQTILRDESTKPLRISKILKDEKQLYPDQKLVEEPVILSQIVEGIQEEWISEEKHEEIQEQPVEEKIVEQETELHDVSGEWLPEEILISTSQSEEDKYKTEFHSWELEEEQLIIIPKTLRFAKYLLDQGEFDAAYEIFQTYIKKPQHLEDIKQWITDAISMQDKSISQLWELLGDIAQKQNHHKEALSSYTRAISILLNNP